MLARELVETICARLDLALSRRELRGLQREFPPRHGASSFWPALVLVALGAGGAMWKVKSETALALAKSDQLAEMNGRLVPLQIVSDPPGARAEISWPGGKQIGTTPMSMRFARGLLVHVDLSKGDSWTYGAELFIDQPQIIRASMLRQPLPPLRDFPADRERP
jgi:hypothetical protein